MISQRFYRRCATAPTGVPQQPASPLHWAIVRHPHNGSASVISSTVVLAQQLQTRGRLEYRFPWEAPDQAAHIAMVPADLELDRVRFMQVSPVFHPVL